MSKEQQDARLAALVDVIEDVVSGSRHNGICSLPGLAAENSIGDGNCGYTSREAELAYVEGWVHAHIGIALQLEEALAAFRGGVAENADGRLVEALVDDLAGDTAGQPRATEAAIDACRRSLAETIRKREGGQ